jgi:NADH:ubiquinone oxidoreductase subunit K
MIPIEYIMALGAALFAIGIAGIAADRHFVVIMLGIELMFAASTVLLIGFFSWRDAASPDAALMLFAIFSVAAAEIITLISFYIYMKHNGIDFDVSKLSRLKW